MLSFAPLKGPADLNLLDFLGVDMPLRARNYIIEGGELARTTERSLLNALRVYAEVLQAIRDDGIHVPLGINIEQLTKSNLSSSIRMLSVFAEIIDGSADDVLRKVEEIAAE